MNPARPGLISRNVLTTTLTVVLVALALYLIYLLRSPIAWLVIAAFISVALAGPVNFLGRYMRRGFAITLSYLGLLLIPAGIFAIVVPPIVREGTEFIDEIPRYAADVNAWVRDNERLNDLNAEYDITGKIQERANELPGRVGDAASWLGDLGLGLVNSTFAFITILIMSVFITASGRRWVDGLLGLQPKERADRLRGTLDRMGNAMGAYVAGALFQAAIAGITTFIVLTILGVPFAAPLAVLTALFDLIPLIGATIGAVIVGVITLFADFPIDTIVWTIWAIIYQQVENTVIQPRIQNRAVGVHPLGVIVAVLFGATLFGIGGALLAVPIAASIQIGVRDWWTWRQAEREQRLEASSSTAGGVTATTAPPGRGAPP
jgi:predicted PurR-regulated permease PerM